MVHDGNWLSRVLTPLQELLGERGLTICAAESCTGGLVCAALTELPGSSEYFLGGVVTYSNDAKVRHLGVTQEILDQRGAVSPEVAEQMARGARDLFAADVAVSVTGIAGPHAEGDKAVGLTYIGAAHRDRVQVRAYHWSGDRTSNRMASVEAALALAFEVLLGQ